MYILDVLYYHYYKFYSKSRFDGNPHMTTTITLSISIGFLIWGAIDLSLAIFYCKIVDKVFPIGASLLIFGLNYRRFHSNKRGRLVMENYPLLFGSRKLSKWTAVLFFISSSSIIFWCPLIVKKLLITCGHSSFNLLND
jgi:hypothetical protein